MPLSNEPQRESEFATVWKIATCVIGAIACTVIGFDRVVHPSLVIRVLFLCASIGWAWMGIVKFRRFQG